MARLTPLDHLKVDDPNVELRVNRRRLKFDEILVVDRSSGRSGAASLSGRFGNVRYGFVLYCIVSAIPYARVARARVLRIFRYLSERYHFEPREIVGENRRSLIEEFRRQTS